MLSRLIRMGIRRGLIGGSRPWLVVGMAAAAAAVVRRIVRQRPETVFTTPLRPGEALEVRVVHPSPAGGRR